MSPSYLLIAKKLLESGKSLSMLQWREFEHLIGDLLEKDGWKVIVTQATKDGGVDIIANKEDSVLGMVKTVWQAKKYSGNNLVKLNEVRELYAAREEQKASKALIVSTNKLTKDAIKWIKKDEYRFGYKEGSDIENSINKI
jgi:restriction system protein